MYQKIQFDEFLRFLLQNGHIKEAKAVYQVYRKSMGTQSTNEDFESLSMDCFCNIDQKAFDHPSNKNETTEIETQIVGDHLWMKATFDVDELRGNQAPTMQSLGSSLIEAIDNMELRLMGIKPGTAPNL